MTGVTQAIVVDWFEPLRGVEEARHAITNAGFEDGLYMLIGRIRYQKKRGELKYIGIAKTLLNRVRSQHPAISVLTQECTLWLGEVSSIGRYQRKPLESAERAHIYFLQLPLNKRKKKNPPPEPVTVLNRWWGKDQDPSVRRRNRPDRGWPDVIDYDGITHGRERGYLWRK